MRTRAERRHLNKKKALRKRAIARSIYYSSDSDFEYYDNLHAYSKNKIHCSCSMCRNKTNGRNMWGTHIKSEVNKGGYNYSRQDIRNIERLKYTEDK